MTVSSILQSYLLRTNNQSIISAPRQNVLPYQGDQVPEPYLIKGSNGNGGFGFRSLCASISLAFNGHYFMLQHSWGYTQAVQSYEENIKLFPSIPEVKWQLIQNMSDFLIFLRSDGISPWILTIWSHSVAFLKIMRLFWDFLRIGAKL